MEKPLMWGKTRFYFPEHPDNQFNGCGANSCGGYNGKLINNLKCRELISTFPLNEHNEKSYPWTGGIDITPEKIGLPSPLLVRIWSDQVNRDTEVFYLVDKA